LNVAQGPRYLMPLLEVMKLDAAPLLEEIKNEERKEEKGIGTQ